MLKYIYACFANPRYEWNEWALRRRALQLTNLRQKATHSTQTGLSHFKRDTDTQAMCSAKPQFQAFLSNVSRERRRSLVWAHNPGLVDTKTQRGHMHQKSHIMCAQKGKRGQCGEKLEFSSLFHFGKFTLKFVAIIYETPVQKKWGQLVVWLGQSGRNVWGNRWTS
eukprot:759946-Pelagomonas_calceolata.AAC.6